MISETFSLSFLQPFFLNNVIINIVGIVDDVDDNHDHDDTKVWHNNSIFLVIMIDIWKVACKLKVESYAHSSGFSIIMRKWEKGLITVVNELLFVHKNWIYYFSYINFEYWKLIIVITHNLKSTLRIMIDIRLLSKLYIN